VTVRIVEHVGRTDLGRQRSVNEDSLVLAPPFFAVADGMGGAKAGEVASALAAETFEGEADSGEAAEVQLTRILREANRRIYELAVSDDSHRGMGTTVTAAKVIGDEVSLGHVGDSRAYRLRDGDLEQLTRDHSLVAELERSGQITPEAAEHHPQRSIITRALGPEPEVEVDLQTVPVQAGDVFLICSDGLTTMLDDEQIARILTRATSLEAAVRALVDEANRAGGRDNITALAFRLEDAAAPHRRPEDATLIGPSAEEAGLTATEVRRRAAAAAARERREQLAAGPPRRRLRRGATAVAALALVAALAFGAWYGNRQVWFLGTDDGGRVALYRGLPYELPLGISLYDERYASPVQTESLLARRREAVTGHDLRSRADAVSLIEDIERSEENPPAADAEARTRDSRGR